MNISSAKLEDGIWHIVVDVAQKEGIYTGTKQNFMFDFDEDLKPIVENTPEGVINLVHKQRLSIITGTYPEYTEIRGGYMRLCVYRFTKQGWKQIANL